MALVNVAMMQHCESFLDTWETEGPKCIGLQRECHNTRSLDEANDHLHDLVSDAVKGAHLHAVTRDLQVMDPDKLMPMPNSCYLQALFEVGVNHIIQ